MATAKKSADKKTTTPKKSAAKKPTAKKTAEKSPASAKPETDMPLAKMVHYIREAGAPDESVIATILEGDVGGALKLQLHTDGEIVEGVMPDDQVPYGEHYYEPIA